MLDLTRKSFGVWVATPGLVLWTEAHIAFLKDEAPSAPKLRARILAHQEGEAFHEMLIAFTADSRCEMHSHEHPESLYVIEGLIKVEFEDRGTLYLQAQNFLRIPAGVRHQPMPLSDCVILESAQRGNLKS